MSAGFTPHISRSADGGLENGLFTKKFLRKNPNSCVCFLCVWSMNHDSLIMIKYWNLNLCNRLNQFGAAKVDLKSGV